MQRKSRATGGSERAEAGFTILEVLIAMSVLMFAINATMSGAGYAARVQSTAEAKGLASELSGYIMARLMVVAYNDPLLNDTIPDGVIGRWGTNGSGNADHDSLAEYARVVEGWNAANDRALFLQSDGSGIPEIWYEGYTFHVAWNINDNSPFPNYKEIQVIVQAPPYTDSIATSSRPWDRQATAERQRMRSDP